ncbi:MAG: dockerin type I repeat-containing protein [Candidatus Sumerlaeota bacterium]|nr:dockerin type I repeat-containing protein [Candidatus Sumerlaeota bacterium]
MMSRLSILMVTILMCGVAIAQEPIPYKTGFEASEGEGFDVDVTLDGKDGWTAVSATITNVVHQGTVGELSVALAENSQIDKTFSAAGETVVWMEGYFRGAGTTAEPSFPADPAASAIVFFSATNGIECLDGNGTGGGSWSSTGVTLNADNWYKVTIRQDYTGKKWRCYIDDAQKPASDLGFRDNVTELHGFRNFADTASYLDTFRVLPAKKGDANADGKVDAADVISLVNDPNGTSMDIIQKDNADVNSSGTIDVQDLTALIDKILGRS